MKASILSDSQVFGFGQNENAGRVKTRQDNASTNLLRLASWRDYFALLKPRVMSLVVFTAVVGYVAAPVQNNIFLAIISILAIALGGGAAGSLNMWFDADIDGLMKRTKMRPVPAGKIAKEEAFFMGILFSILSVTLLTISGGYLAASLLAFAIFFYSVVYSMWLKRHSTQNIVIGGLAGALPPMVAWAAAGGAIDLNAILLVAIIFLWTPPHSWALALYKAGDYSRAGIPMMPVVRGHSNTRLQILLYSVILVCVAIIPAFTGLGGKIYFTVASISGILFFILALKLFLSHAGEIDGRLEGRSLYQDGASSNKPARNLFAFSLLYLTSLYAALLFEHGFGLYFPFGGN